LKLIFATLPDSCEGLVSKELVSSSYQVTTIASTSGWLRKGMTTLLVGVEDRKCGKALQIMRKICNAKKDPSSQYHASMFVLKVQEYIHF
jgi:uncharacterized protein YaaQ